MRANQTNKRPGYKELIFVKNENRIDIYDLQNSNFRKFKYFRLSEPRVSFLIKQGAKYVIESWDKGEKVLFTGLIPFNQYIYFGDHKNTKTGRKSLIVVNIKDKEVKLYYFNNFSLKVSKRLVFINNFLKHL